MKLKTTNIYFFNSSTEEQSFRQIQPIIRSLSKYEYNIFYNTQWSDKKKEMLNKLAEDISIGDYYHHYREVNTLFICFNIFDVLKLKRIITKNKNFKILFRPRGILPEESYLKKKSIARKLVLNLIEREAVRNCDFLCFISNNQRTHFYSKYNKIINQKRSLVIKNYLEYEESVFGSQVKDDDSLKIVYSGGFSKWQKIETAFQLIKKLEQKNINIKFSIFTFEKNHKLAWEYVDKYKLKSDVIVEYHQGDQLLYELKKNDIGILFRDDDIVNLTSSPFKIVDYINSGLGIIATDNIGDYSDILRDREYAYLLKIDKLELNHYEMLNITNFIRGFLENKEDIKRTINYDSKNTFNLENEIKKLHQFLESIK